MYTPLQFSDEIEQQVRWVEDTDPGAIIEQTLNRLRDGLGARDVLRAAALALVRSTELPASHHGGAVHPINGLRGCFKTSERLSGELSYLPLIQHVALCNHHIHSPHMGPYIMPELEPMDGSIDAAYETFHDNRVEHHPYGKIDGRHGQRPGQPGGDPESVHEQSALAKTGGGRAMLFVADRP